MSASFFDKKNDHYPRTIRVLIKEENLTKIKVYPFKSIGGSALINNHLQFKAQSTGMISFHQDSFYCIKQNQAWRLTSPLVTIEPKDGHLLFENKEYQGTISLYHDTKHKKIFIINELDLEQYVYSVVRSECIPYWPAEIQKVQAVTSRSYALYHVLASRARKKIYDIKASTIHQVYEGHHTIKHLQEAITATRHQVLMYNNKPALTMFDICCGGIIPAQLTTIDKSKPYLFRPNRCTYCRPSSYYQWRKTFSYKEFLSRLKKEKNINKKLVTVGVKKEFFTEHHPSGVTKKILVKGPHKEIALSPFEFKRAFTGQLRSPTFTLTREKELMHIDGFGFGHHHGLCQCGAFYLVKAGWSYKKILRFYFPCTKLKRSSILS